MELRMTTEFTPDQRARIKQAARDLLSAHDAGRKCDPHGVEWAQKVLRMNPGDPQGVPFDDDLLPELEAL